SISRWIEAASRFPSSRLTTTPTTTLRQLRPDHAYPEASLCGSRKGDKWRIGAEGAHTHIYIAPANCKFQCMIELVRTNDPVVISFIESLMRDAGIGFLVADQNMSVMDGSLGILPRRILVESERAEEARRILADAGVGNEMRPK